MSRSARSSALMILVMVVGAFVRVAFADPYMTGPAPSHLPVTQAEFSKKIEQVIRGEDGLGLPEIEYIRHEAVKRGLRVWIQGGSATTLLFYIRDLAAGGPNAVQKASLREIFRPAQDFDLILEGDHKKIKEFQKHLGRKFRYERGGKTAWDFALLRERWGAHMPLLGNEDYLMQHTDSLSTGLVELTDPPKGDLRVRDLYEWEVENNQFLQDVRDGKITFYYSDKHHSTSRYQSGQNPEMIAAIRYFIKVFQFDVEMNDKDLRKLWTIVEKFDPNHTRNKYVSKWFHFNIRKLILSAKSPIKAQGFLEESGLKEKLLALGDVLDPESSSYLLTVDCIHLLE